MNIISLSQCTFVVEDGILLLDTIKEIPDMNLKQKFFITFIMVSIIPVLIIVVFVYQCYAALSRHQTTEVYERIYESAIHEANQSISEVKHVMESMAFYTDAENSIINDLKKYTKKESFTSRDVYESNNNLKLLIQNLIYSSDNLNGIFIFTPSGQTLGYGYNNDIHANYVPSEDLWYEKTLDLQGKIYVNGISVKDFLIYNKPSISFSKALYDVYSHEFLGILLIDCKPEVFDLSRINTLPESVLLTIEYEDGSILYSNVDSLSEPLPTIKNRMPVRKTTLDMSGLTLISSADMNQLYGESELTKRLILILSIIYVLLFSLISIVLSRYLTTPITYLSHQMANHTLNSYVTDEKYLNRSDEIGILYNEYNSMLEEQEKYIKKEYQNKLITLDSQMKSLEAQINSHFLYNTLESINSLAEIEGNEKISTMSMALGNMFRYSIKAKSELVTVSEEIANVMDYVSIQRIRFANRFQVKLLIPPDMYQCRILKLIFQPLVENAFIHGLNQCGAGDTISIIGSFEHDNLSFQVQDNGIGMSADQLSNINAMLSEPPRFKELGRRSSQNIGLKNISSRIELYYGAGYGLSVSSIPAEGTTVSLTLPHIQ